MARGDYYSDNTDYKKTLPERTPKKERGEDDENEVYYATKFSVSDGGQQTYGAFKDEGKQFFEDTLKTIKGNKKKNVLKAANLKMMENNVAAAATQTGSKKRKRKQEKVVKASTFSIHFSDDESDTDDEDEEEVGGDGAESTNVSP